MRVSDVDRDEVCGLLGQHFAEGRIALDELRGRIGAAQGAATEEELRQVLADLPSVTSRPRFRGAVWTGLGGFFVILIAVVPHHGPATLIAALGSFIGIVLMADDFLTRS
ncbi:DUF1707 domain-containing protein [Nonomuraea sp. NPDC049504]|uniref:DUF1707 SHOCT-like domain-containing protein n=1 Tax=Nonomuraea sp. NPDC049504 TaxID=3154729 RepID=UPI003444F30B